MASAATRSAGRLPCATCTRSQTVASVARRVQQRLAHERAHAGAGGAAGLQQRLCALLVQHRFVARQQALDGQALELRDGDAVVAGRRVHRRHEGVPVDVGDRLAHHGVGRGHGQRVGHPGDGVPGAVAGRPQQLDVASAEVERLPVVHRLDRAERRAEAGPRTLGLGVAEGDAVVDEGRVALVDGALGIARQVDVGGAGHERRIGIPLEDRGGAADVVGVRVRQQDADLEAEPVEQVEQPRRGRVG